jgi:hypothetical protein
MTKSKKEKSKRYYKSMLADHKSMLRKMRFIINHALDEIVTDIKLNSSFQISVSSFQNHPEIAPKMTPNSPPQNTQPIENERDMPLERELASLDLNQIDIEELHNLTEKIEATLPEEDMKILEQYVENYIKDKPEFACKIINDLGYNYSETVTDENESLVIATEAKG